MFLAVLARSAAAGMAMSLGYFIVELIALPILNVASWGETMVEFILGNNVNGWMASALVTVETPSANSTDNQVKAAQAFLVILVYTVVFGAATFLVFLRRDIGGAKGD